jgi:hypothetical protein
MGLPEPWVGEAPRSATTYPVWKIEAAEPRVWPPLLLDPPAATEWREGCRTSIEVAVAEALAVAPIAPGNAPTVVDGPFLGDANATEAALVSPPPSPPRHPP